jgi:hypothetical protein
MVMDGTYTESLEPALSGQPGMPVTVKALNDGKVILDGQGQRRPVALGSNNEAHGSWFVLEGLVARNGSDAVFHVRGSNNVLRRVSAYNANTDLNSTVILLWGSNNLVEDALAAGTGRYMIESFQGEGNTMRRVFTRWEGWDGRQFCGVSWPNGNNVGVYNASNTTVENVIAYGRSLKGIMVQANADNARANNNAVLGSMALLQGRDHNGSVWTYGTGQAQPTSRPGPSDCPGNLTLWSDGGDRYGFGLFGQGTLDGNVFRDVLATDNVGVGLSIRKPYGIGARNTTIDHATLYNNGAELPSWEAAMGGNIYVGANGVETVTNSKIPGAPFPQGEGARFQYRYVNRQLTGEPLLPWPMESRAQSELGISITAIVEQYATEASQQIEASQ